MSRGIWEKHCSPSGRGADGNTCGYARASCGRPGCGAGLLILPAPASAAFLHTVLAGESLTSVAATDGLTVSELAAENGLAPTTELIAGSQLAIPPQEGGYRGSLPDDRTAPRGERPPFPQKKPPLRRNRPPPRAKPTQGQTTTGTPTSTTKRAAPAGPATPPSGQYVVQPGDTLTGIAERSGKTVEELAAANGLNPEGALLAGLTRAVGGLGPGDSLPWPLNHAGTAPAVPRPRASTSYSPAIP